MAENTSNPQVVGEHRSSDLSSLREEEYYYHRRIVGQANLTDPALSTLQRKKLSGMFSRVRRSSDLGSVLAHHARYQRSSFLEVVCRRQDQRFIHCVDRHLAKYKNKAALIFVPEPEDEATVSVTYRELYVRVNEFAALLRDFCGLKSGDRVTIHMPMVPELPVTMLACAAPGNNSLRCIGGFKRRSLRHARRRSGSASHPMDGYYRNGKRSTTKPR